MAYLKTEANLDYRDCKICYYTYTMFDEPNKYRVNVNLWLHYTQNTFTKTLNLDEYFDKESAALNYGIEQGKKYIDLAYTQGKINILKPNITLKPKATKGNKVKVDKAKSDKQ